MRELSSIRPRPATIGVPVFVDAVRSSGDSGSLVRCSYLAVQADEAAEAWPLGVSDLGLPLLLLGLHGVILGPIGAAEFTVVWEIDGLYARLHELNLDVACESVWLPLDACRDALRAANAVRSEAPQPGDVFRVGSELFLAGLRYRQGRISYEEFEAVGRGVAVTLRFAEAETAVFAHWHSAEIGRLQRDFAEQGSDLTWRSDRPAEA